MIGVSFKALQASAVGLVGLRVALGIGTAGVFEQAGFDAISLSALVRIRAVFISLAANWNTLNLRISNHSFRTSAQRSMAFEKTFGSEAAVAGIFTKSVDASLLFGTVVI